MTSVLLETERCPVLVSQVFFFFGDITTKKAYSYYYEKGSKIISLLSKTLCKQLFKQIIIT